MRFLNGIIAFLLPFIIFSCTEKNEKLSTQEALEVAHKIDSSIFNKRPKYFDELFDESAFANKLRRAMQLNKSRETTAEIKRSLKRMAFGDKIIQSLGENGHYQLVKHYEKADTQHLIFRLFSSEGINYHDFELIKQNGKPGIADVFIYMTGEDLSKTIFSLMTSFNENKEEGDDAVAMAKSLVRIRDMIMDNRYDEAYEYYQKFPDRIKNSRTVQLLHLQITKGLSEEKYLAALNNFEALYPNDPNLSLLMIDAYIMNKEYDRALVAIDKLDHFINTDPFLDYFRGLITKMDNRSDTAIKFFEQLHRNFPDFGDGALELIATYIEAGMNDKANAMIKKYEKNAGFDQETLKLYLSMKRGFQKE